MKNVADAMAQKASQSTEVSDGVFVSATEQDGKLKNYTTVTVAVAGKEAQLGIHGMEAPGVPILLSVKALEKLGAIIDFKHGVAILSEVSDRVIRLERAPSGHYLLDLAGDMVLDSEGMAKAATPEASEGVRRKLDHN